MQPNKSVEEIIHKIIQEQVASEVIYQDGFAEKKLLNCLVKLEKELVNFVTSHTNTVLQGVVEMVGKLKQKELEYTKKPSTNTAIRRMMVRRQSRKNTLDEVSSLLNDQIINNEK